MTDAVAPLVVHFGGVVHPQSGSWRFYGPVNVRRDTTDLRIAVMNSTFSVRAVVKEPPEVGSDVAGFVSRLWYDTDAVVMSVLDALGFCLAAPLTIQLITGSIDGRDALIMGKPSMPDLSIADNDEVSGDQLGQYLGHAVTNAHVRHALADLRMAMGFTDDCFFYCYRAVESMRHHFLDDAQATDDGAARKKSWERLRAALDVDQATLEALHVQANARRHGGDTASEFRERHEAVGLTRGLLTKFVATLPAPPPMPEFDV
ncbi:hypothetical protein [Williamsia deligens]|uniref:DUF8168 domain-containing protein n=1 Tax=Williamsia deligens TaxID=321325 RepID=A0ABW3GCE6_9NOCA|nr:hypothetical protein [Williamsia deligens]MCP2195610.1 hypothetical protein [Williamsia deligens]